MGYVRTVCIEVHLWNTVLDLRSPAVRAVTGKVVKIAKAPLHEMVRVGLRSMP